MSRLRRQGSSRYPFPSELVSAFTPKEVETLTSAFAKADADADASGRVPASAIKGLLESLGEYVSDANVAELLRETDVDGDAGLVGFGEFLEVVVRLRMGRVEKSTYEGVLGKPKPAAGGATFTMNTVKTETGATHSYSEEEKAAFAEHINRVLAGDARLADRLPLDPTTDALFRAVGDGLLLCKLINKAQPDTIDERALNQGEKLNVYQVNENQNIAVNAAKAIGCKVVNVHNEDLIEGREHIVLGLVWQIVRIQLLSQINLHTRPELVRLLEPGEELSDLLKLPPDQLLLRWLNFHLKAAGDARRVKNFGDDLKDSHVYTVVLNQISPKTCSLDALKADDLAKRAEMVIAGAASFGVESFIKPANIVDGNQKLNLAFCAQIFNTNPGLSVTEEELHDMAGLLDDDVGDTREERVFRVWINSLGIDDLYVNHLFEDLRDGVVLLQVMDRVEPGVVSWKAVNRPPKNKFKRVENSNYVVVLGKSTSFKFSLVGIGGIDIVDGKKKPILAIVWQLLRHYSLKLLASLSHEGQLATDRDILDWANARVARTGKESRMASFRDPSLAVSIFFLNLCSALAPGIVDPSIVTEGASDEDRLLNAKYAISVARKLGVCVFCAPEDLVEVKPKMVLTFCAALMAWDQHAPGKAL